MLSNLRKHDKVFLLEVKLDDHCLMNVFVLPMIEDPMNDFKEKKNSFSSFDSNVKSIILFNLFS